jgi:hypothetical protein
MNESRKKEKGMAKRKIKYNEIEFFYDEFSYEKITENVYEVKLFNTGEPKEIATLMLSKKQITKL